MVVSLRRIKFIAMKSLTFKVFVAGILFLPVLFSCEKGMSIESADKQEPEAGRIALDVVAGMLSELPLEREHFREVYSAVEASSGNGYDEEYTMSDLFASPGKGVGDTQTKAAAVSKAFSTPLRELIRDHVRSSVATRAGGDSAYGDDAEAYLSALAASDVQIYWPYSENWDGETPPVFTFDPGDDSEVNVGYRVLKDEFGNASVEKIEVTEDYAEKNPVWVVNRNSDCGFTSLEIMRREHPEWDNGGGALIIGGGTGTKAGGTALKTLVLKDFTMKRNYDCWFAGGSEFFVKAGSVSDFYAATEAELQLYNPLVTDFMIVVKRKQKGQALTFNTVLVSDWSEQLEKVAFMIVEDDGGRVEQWKCSAVVKIKSKSYGFDVSLPFNSRDDIVWRGQLSRRFIEATSNMTGHFGDVDITFEVLEY